ncbi:MAG: hypothetical protein ACRDHY_17835, partial [Anaerolineales bacterium]
RRLQRLRSELPAMGDIVAANQRDVERLDRRLVHIRQDLTTAQAEIEALTRRRWFRRPDHHAIAQTDHRNYGDQRQLHRLHNERSSAVRRLEHSRARLNDAERAVARIPEVETAVAHRRQWLLSHPAELEWEHDLAARLEQTGRGKAAQEPGQPDDREVEPGIDLRKIDLSPRHPQTGLERQLWETIGIHRAFADPDIALPPLPGSGIDGPDLGR